MLRYLRVQNWKSYYEPVEFTMVATRERRYGERLAKVGRSRILPVAAVYGANASGKSTLVDALEALRGLILEARSVGAVLRLTPHLLKGVGEPTAFTIEFVVGAPRPDGLVEDRTFLYDVVADRRRIHRESLVEVRSRTEEVLFEREGGNVELYGDLDEDPRANAHKTVIADNETFLGVLGADSEGAVSVAYDWFARHLTVIHPGAEYVHLSILFQLRTVDERSVFVVDELENSMHPRLMEELIASFLDGLEPEGRRQLVFTTHEVAEGRETQFASNGRQAGP